MIDPGDPGTEDPNARIDPRFDGIALPRPHFADDDGSPDPELSDALEAFAGRTADLYAVVAALAPTRLLVPLVAVLDSTYHCGDQRSGSSYEDDYRSGARVDHRTGALPAEKDSHLATPTLVAPDGRRALLAFTGVPALKRWRPDARPLPVSASRAAESALTEQADVLLIDAAGPVPVAIGGSALAAIAAERAWLPPYEDREVLAAVREIADGFHQLRGVELAAAEPPDQLLVTLRHDPGLSPTTVVALATELAKRLSRSAPLLERLDAGVAIAVQPA